MNKQTFTFDPSTFSNQALKTKIVAFLTRNRGTAPVIRRCEIVKSPSGEWVREVEIRWCSLGRQFAA